MSSGNDQQLVRIPADSVELEGVLEVPQEAQGVVLFAHGSGSSRHSTRNNFVAKVLRDAGLGTLLFDLLTREEDLVYENRFDIPLLARRLKAATLWFKEQSSESVNIGYFGASTGSAAALIASADLTDEIGAVVSRGGRTDLAGEFIYHIQAPTLLIVGGHDEIVIELNKKAYEMINSEKKMVIVPGATHLFEEPGAMDEVTRLAVEWFKKYLMGLQLWKEKQQGAKGRTGLQGR